MTSISPVPDFPDRESAREWMRQLRGGDSHENRRPQISPEEFSENQRSRLLHTEDDLRVRDSRRRIEVALVGDMTAGHQVPVSTLGPFLTNLQESISAVAQALAGRPTNSASIPREIREATALSAVSTFASSFGVTMYGPPQEPEEDNPFSDWTAETTSILDDAVERVMNIVDLSEGAIPTDDLLAEQLIPLGQRSTNKIGSLTAVLSNAGIGMRIAWHVPGNQTRRSAWSPPGVQRVRDLCEHSEFSEARRVSVIGLLGSVSAFHSKVEIRTDAGETIQASTSEELTSRLGYYFNKRVEATAEMTHVKFSGGRERTIYHVQEMRSLS